MDKFTTVANNILSETIESKQSVIIEGMLMHIQKLAMLGHSTEEIIKKLGIQDTKDARTAINYVVNAVDADKEKYAAVSDEEKEMELEDPLKNKETKQGLEAIKLASKLGVGPARSLFQRGEQKLAGALSRKYAQLANVIDRIKL